jgi:hypothetical protein
VRAGRIQFLLGCAIKIGTAFHPAWPLPRSVKRTRRPRSRTQPRVRKTKQPRKRWWRVGGSRHLFFFFVSATARRLLLRGARQCFSPTFDGNAAEAAGSGWEVCEREYRANGAQPFFSLRGNGVPKKPSLLGSGRRCTHGRCRAVKCDVGVPPHLCMGQLTQVKGVGGGSPQLNFFFTQVMLQLLCTVDWLVELARVL